MSFGFIFQKSSIYILVIESVFIIVLFSTIGGITYNGEFHSNMNVLLSWSGDLFNLGPAIYAVVNAHPDQHISFYITTVNADLLPKYKTHFAERPILNTKFYFETCQTRYLTKRIWIVGYDTYIRIVFPNAHPEMERFLQLDGDAIVVQDIKDMYFHDFNNQSAIVVFDFARRFEGFKNYFNAGVMVFNNFKYINDNILNKSIEYLKWLNGHMGRWYNDQRVLNKMFIDSRIVFPQKYNEFDFRKFGNNTKIFHFYRAKCKPYNQKCNRTQAPYKLWDCFYKTYKEKPLLWRDTRNITICTNEMFN